MPRRGGLLRYLVGVVAPLVPARRRGEWRREWHAELRALESVPTGAWLARRWRRAALVVAVLRDVAAMRRQHRLNRRRPLVRLPALAPEHLEPAWAEIGTELLGGWARDVRLAARSLARAPAFMLCAIGVLALGIGSTAGLFTVVHGLLLRPLPYADPDRLVMIWETYPGYDADFSTSPQSFADWRGSTASFTGLAAYGTTAPSLQGEEWPERLPGAAVTADFFRVLGVEPLHGRWLGEADNQEGAAPTVLLHHALWTRRFGADPALVGRTITLDGVPHQVVGVMGEDFWHFDPYESEPTMLWLPAAKGSWRDYDRGDRMLRVVGRLRQDVSLEQVRAELDAVAAAIAEAHPDTHEEWGITAVPLHEEVVDDVRGGVLVLFAAVGLVLLIACANVANLLLARSAARGRELAVRAMLGAGRLRLVRLQLAEAILLALLGGALGLVLANWLAAALVSRSPTQLPLSDRLVVDAPVVLITIGGALLVGCAIGLGTALCGGSLRLAGAIGAGDRATSDGPRARRLRSIIVAAEVALSLVLLAGAGLLINSHLRLNAVDPGFDDDNVLSFSIQLRTESGQDDGAAAARFFEQLTEALGEQPQIVVAGGTTHLPFSGWNMTDRVYRIDRPVPEEPPSVELRRVTGGYLEAMGIPLVSGRGIAAGDRGGAPPVTVINEVLAEMLFDAGSPLGRQLGFGKGGAPRREIVGVVGGVKHRALRETNRPVAYVPFAQYPRSSLWLVARAAGDPLALVGTVRRIVGELDSRQPVTRFAPLRSLVGESIAVERFYATTLGAFAGVALLLASVGIVGVVSLSVQRRVREIGIRVAVGARSGTVVLLIVRQSMVPVLGGIVLGLAGVVLSTRVLESLLYEITPTDPTTLLAVTGCLVLVAAAASWLPARRSARIDPLEALRAD